MSIKKIKYKFFLRLKNLKKEIVNKPSVVSLSNETNEQKYKNSKYIPSENVYCCKG